MKILLISPLGMPINAESRYTGIEKLVWQYSAELSKQHDVTVMGHADSVFPDRVKVLPTVPKGDIFIESELQQYKQYSYLLRGFEVIHDFSHQHLASRFNALLPSLNIFWHSPAIAQYPKAPYNVIALSEWARREFKRYYKQESRYQQTIVIDTEVYKPAGQRGDRFLTLGKMSPEKGNFEVALMCKQLGVPLDIAGGRGAEHGSDPLTDYERNINLIADGKPIKFLGEVSDEEKIKLMQTCKALVYYMPKGYTEVTSHKLQEAMLCGAPVVVANSGAMPEIVTHGVDGFLCNIDNDYVEAIKSVGHLTPEKTYEANKRKYAIADVCAEYVKLYEQVAGGLKW